MCVVSNQEIHVVNVQYDTTVAAHPRRHTVRGERGSARVQGTDLVGRPTTDLGGFLYHFRPIVHKAEREHDGAHHLREGTAYGHDQSPEEVASDGGVCAVRRAVRLPMSVYRYSMYSEAQTTRVPDRRDQIGER